MKKTSIVTGTVIIIIILILIIGGIIFIHKNLPTTKSSQAVVNDTNPSVSATQSTTNPANVSEATAKTSESSHSIYSEGFRTKARNDFIGTCVAKIGHQNESICSCVADSLGANYTDLQLTYMFSQYRSSDVVPNEVKKAYETCKKN